MYVRTTLPERSEGAPVHPGGGVKRQKPCHPFPGGRVARFTGQGAPYLAQRVSGFPASMPYRARLLARKLRVRLHEGDKLRHERCQAFPLRGVQGHREFGIDPEYTDTAFGTDLESELASRT